MIDSDPYRDTVVSMLNALGDRSTPCPSNKNGCQGCDCDASFAMDKGLADLGYETWAEFHKEEIEKGWNAA